jgi:hypothetical protein
MFPCRGFSICWRRCIEILRGAESATAPAESRLLRINHREALCLGNHDQPGIRTDNGIDNASVSEVERYGKLDTVERADALTRLWPIEA